MSTLNNTAALSLVESVSEIIGNRAPKDETLLQVADTLANTPWYGTSHATARVTHAGKTFSSPGYKLTPWTTRAGFMTIDDHQGEIALSLANDGSDAAVDGESDKGTADKNGGANITDKLNELQEVLRVVARMVCGYLDAYNGRKKKPAKRKKII